ncbi:tryptophanyl-tRNA synthetase [Coprinopsis sp. MPI-PUGE-AT-0042]|nr:tryptophanyl-tRNA synthetase [Coprinopsis sp. MPI-PUGE-AT-0042]
MLSSCRRELLRRKLPGCALTRSTTRHIGTTGSSAHLQAAQSGSSAPSPTARPRIIFSGIQPTGIPHLGNYLGALSNWVQLQKDAREDDKLIFSIVGWHALTLPQNAKELSASRWDMLATILAVGIDPKRSIIFHQDDNPCHTELAWILNCITPVGKLRRMTTWKCSKRPDILAYRATHVPVGEDQTQHLELSRDLAQLFNKTFVPGKKRFFPPPTQLITPSKRILSLRDPRSKMSKSSPDVNSRILLTDSPEKIVSKIRSSVTDSIKGITYDPVERPGISNLLTILSACLGQTPADVAVAYANKTNAELKADVGDAVETLFQGPRAEFERLRNERGYLEQVAKDGAERARALSEETMKQVRSMVGLR